MGSARARDQPEAPRRAAAGHRAAGRSLCARALPPRRARLADQPPPRHRIGPRARRADERVRAGRADADADRRRRCTESPRSGRGHTARRRALPRAGGVPRRERTHTAVRLTRRALCTRDRRRTARARLACVTAARRAHPQRARPGRALPERHRGARRRRAGEGRRLPRAHVRVLPVARGARARSDLRPARPRVRLAPVTAEGGAAEPAVGGQRIRDARDGLPFRHRRRPARRPTIGTDRRVDSGLPVRDALRALDGLRGVPRLSHPRGMGSVRRQRRGRRAGPRAHRPADHDGLARHGDLGRRLRHGERSRAAAVRARARRRRPRRRDARARAPGAVADGRARPLELVAAGASAPRRPPLVEAAR